MAGDESIVLGVSTESESVSC